MRKRAPAVALMAARLLTVTATSAMVPADHRVTVPGGLTVRVPPGWHLVRARVTDVVVPIPRLAMATFAVKLSPHPCECGMPNLKALPRGGAFLLSWEYPGLREPQLRRVAPRPAHISVPPGNPRFYECAGPSGEISFRLARRAFEVDVYVGPAASRRVRNDVATILQSLETTNTS